MSRVQSIQNKLFSNRKQREASLFYYYYVGTYDWKWNMI